MSAKSLLRLAAPLGLAMLFVIGIMLLMSAPTRAAQDVLYMAPGGDCGSASPCYANLQAALDDAQSGDEVRIASGMYPIQAGADQIALVENSLAIKGGYTTSNWVTPDPEANPTTLNALSQGRVMVISGTLDVTVQGLRLVFGNSEGFGGYHNCYTDWDAGGGLYINQATVTLDQTWILTNTTPNTGFGGGIYAVDATISLSDETIVQANYGGAGGGLFLNHTNASLDQVTVQDNYAGGAWGGCHHGGGGLNVVYNSQVEITNSIIRGNRKLITTSGAGILFQDGEMIVTDSLIEENEGAAVAIVSWQGSDPSANATLSGNVIQNNSGNGVSASNFGANNAITLTNNLLQGNHTDGWGAGLSTDTRATIVNNQILDNRTSGNSSFKGGGVYLKGAESKPILFKDNTVRGNTNSIASGGIGGGIYVEGVNVTLESNIIQGNSANAGISDYSGSGGGIYIAGDATLINNVVTDNGVGGPNGRGAGITVAGAQPLLYHNTIARNTGGSGSGVYVTYSNQPGLPLLYNTIIAEQAIGVEVNSASPQNMATLYGVLWWGNGTNSVGTTFVFDELTGDPAFVDPDGRDYHITPASYAIDTGRSEDGVPGDIDGETRPHYGGYDMGADEWWPLVAVKTVSAETAQPGDVLTYTLTLTNATETDMAVSFVDELPVDFTYLGPLSYNYGSGDYSAGTVSWSGIVLTGTPAVISWPIQVNEGASGEIANFATVLDGYGNFDTDPAIVTVEGPGNGGYLYLPLVTRR